MAEENRASTSTTVNSVSLKLPPFWPEQPTIWFAQTEAQFVIRNINVELTKFYHVVAALDGTTAQRVSDILEIPPRENPYSILKKRLTNAFALSDRERVAQILELNDIGGRLETVSIDRLKCAHVDPVRPIVPAKPPRRGRPPRVRQTPHAQADPGRPIVPAKPRRRGRPPKVGQSSSTFH